MTQVTYYTVIIGKRSCLVTYAEAPAYETKLLPGSFADPGEASSEFRRANPGKLEYLTNATFEHKVGQLASHYQRELTRLQAWNQGSISR